MSDEQASERGGPDLSRRDALKKAAIGAGIAAWSVPTVQALTEIPAFGSATSPGFCPPDLTMQNGPAVPTPAPGWLNDNYASTAIGTTADTPGHNWGCAESGIGCANSRCRCAVANGAFPQRWHYWSQITQWQKEVSFGSATAANNQCRFIARVTLDPHGRHNDGYWVGLPGAAPHCNTTTTTPSQFQYAVTLAALRVPLPAGAASFVAGPTATATTNPGIGMVPTGSPAITTYAGASYINVPLTNYTNNNASYTTGPGWNGSPAWDPATTGINYRVNPVVIDIDFTVNMANCTTAPRCYAPGLTLKLVAFGGVIGLGCTSTSQYWIPGSNCVSANCTNAGSWGGTNLVCGCP